MHRHQLTMKITIGKFREFFDVITKINELLKERNMVPLQIWAPTAGGEMNTVILITDFDSITAWDTEMKKFMSDPDVMKLWREGGQYVDGHPREDLWETAFQIA